MAICTVAFAASSTFAAALSNPGTFRVVPNSGVTIVELPQARLNWIAQQSGAIYAAGIERADARYAEALREIGVDPSIDHSGNLLNEQIQAALRRREIALFDAKHEAAAWANAQCGRLCRVEFID